MAISTAMLKNRKLFATFWRFQKPATIGAGILSLLLFFSPGQSEAKSMNGFKLDGFWWFVKPTVLVQQDFAKTTQVTCSGDVRGAPAHNASTSWNSLPIWARSSGVSNLTRSTSAAMAAFVLQNTAQWRYNDPQKTSPSRPQKHQTFATSRDLNITYKI